MCIRDRFYALFNKLPYQGDREEFKKQIVLQYTWNRTDSLKEMTVKAVSYTHLDVYKRQHKNREKKYGVEKRTQVGIGRWYAKLEAITMKAMASDVNQRYVSADARCV